VARSSKLPEVGYIKYKGKDAKDGIIDAGSAGSALLGLDEALRFFNSQQSPQLTSLEYDIPVQTRPGSWEAIVLGGMAAVSCRIPCDHIPLRSWPLFKARDVMRGVMESLQARSPA
jgi:hypothetical protein